MNCTKAVVNFNKFRLCQAFWQKVSANCAGVSKSNRPGIGWGKTQGGRDRGGKVRRKRTDPGSGYTSKRTVIYLFVHNREHNNSKAKAGRQAGRGEAERGGADAEPESRGAHSSASSGKRQSQQWRLTENNGITKRP